MGRIAAAALLSLIASLALGQLGDPRLHAVPVALGLTAWGLAVVALLGREPPDLPDPLPPDDAPDAARRALFRLLAFALIVRMPLYTWPPTLSDDVWRYVWEGRVWLAGFSPFTHPPDDVALAPLRDAAWARVNHPEVSSIYPPLAQALFVALARFGVPGWKLAMTAADLGTVAVLWRRSPRLGWLWALLPLPAVESAANAHLEAVGALLVALSLGAGGMAAEAAAWLGAMVKLLPGALLVRSGKRLALWALLTAAAFAPLVGAGLTRGFGTYSANWSFNGAIWPWLAAVVGDGPARVALGAAGLAVAGWALATRRRPASAFLWVTGTFVLVSPTVHPWYTLWPLVPALWLGVEAWAWLAALAPLAYLVWSGGTWHEEAAVRTALWLGFALAAIVVAWRRLTRPGPG